MDAVERAVADPLDQLIGDPMMAIALMLWKNRKRQPDMFVQVEANDIKAFEDCVRYLKVNWQVRIERPEGLPEQAAVPAQGNRRAIPYRPAQPPKPFVMITLVDERTGDCIRPIENNEADYDAAQQAGSVRRAKDNARMLADRLMEQARTGEFSLSDMTDAASALVLLAEAV